MSFQQVDMIIMLKEFTTLNIIHNYREYALY